MSFLRYVLPCIDYGEHFLLKSCASINTIPMPAWFDTIPVSWRSKIAFDPAVRRDFLRNNETGLLHSFLHCSRYNRSLNNRTLFHQMGHRVTKPLTVSQMLVNILPTCSTKTLEPRTSPVHVHVKTASSGCRMPWLPSAADLHPSRVELNPLHLSCTLRANISTMHQQLKCAAHLRLAKGFAASACICCFLSSAARFCAMPPPHSGVSATGFLDAACWALSSSSVTRLPCLSR